jgi:hypothetical protein
MIKVLLKGETIAAFAEKSDALAYIDYKHQKIMESFAADQVARYIQEHPVTEYGTKMCPGEVPLKETYPDYKAYSNSLRNDFCLEDEGLGE